MIQLHTEKKTTTGLFGYEDTPAGLAKLVGDSRTNYRLGSLLVLTEIMAEKEFELATLAMISTLSIVLGREEEFAKNPWKFIEYINMTIWEDDELVRYVGTLVSALKGKKNERS